MDLGLSDEFFWSLTLDLFVRLVEAGREREKRADRRSGEIVAMLANVNRDAKKQPEPWTWLDIYPEWKPARREQTEEGMLAAMMMWSRITPV